MSLCLTVQRNDQVFIGADTAIAVPLLTGGVVRTSNEGKKLFQFGDEVMFCSGVMGGKLRNYRVG